MMRIGPMELAVIAAIILLLFGPSMIPRFGKAIGQTIKEARNIKKELSDIGDTKVNL